MSRSINSDQIAEIWRLIKGNNRSEQAASASAEAAAWKGTGVVCLKQYEQQCFIYIGV